MSASSRNFCARNLWPVVRWCALAAVALTWMAAPAAAQRVIFPSQLESQPLGSSMLAQQPAVVVPTQPTTVAPAWDPFATGPAATTPPALSTSPQPYVAQPYSDGVVNSAVKLIQDVRARNAWLARTGGSDGFGIDDLELSTSFGFPTRFNPAPILLTPAFTFNWTDGPNSQPGPAVDVPSRLYDAFLATSWQPQLTPRFGADLALALGVFSDFQYVNSTSFRILGRGLGTWTFNERLKFALGVMYLDRLAVKILPAGGLIWTPNADTRYELLFPNPKLSHRITNWGNAEVWGYVSGEYGGGQWSIEHVTGQHDVINYNDLRVILGVESLNVNGRHLLFEVGYIFDREILYQVSGAKLEPEGTVMLRSGISF